MPMCVVMTTGLQACVRMLVVIQGPLLLKLGLQKLGWLAFFLFLSFWKQKNPDIVSKNKIIEMTKSPKAAAHSSELTPFRCLTSDIHTYLSCWYTV